MLKKSEPFLKTMDSDSAEVLSQIRAQLKPSDREVELQILKGKYFPPVNTYYSLVDKITGGIRNGMYSFAGTKTAEELYSECYYFALPSLAEKLSLVVRGLYRPTKDDREEQIIFFRIDNDKNEVPRYYKEPSCVTLGLAEEWSYFFSEAQRENYITNIVKKEEVNEEKKGKPTFMLAPTGVLIYADGQHYASGSSGVDKLNSLLTWARTKGYEG